MEDRARHLTAILAAIVIAATIAVRLGATAVLSLAYPVAGLLLILLFRSLGRLARVLLVLMALSLAATAFRDGTAVDYRPALFVFAFVLSTGLLREIAFRDPAFQALGETLVTLRGARRFPIVSAGVFVAGFALLIGALQFLAGLVKGREGEGRLAVLRAGLSGYTVIPIVSPLALPFIVISGLIPELDWLRTLPTLAAIALATWLAALVQDRVSGASEPKGPVAVPSRLALSAIPKALSPVALAALLHWGAGLPLSDSALLAITGISLLWALGGAGMPVFATGLTAARNEAVVIAASIATGLAVLSLFPGLGAALTFGFLPGWTLPPLVLFAFVIPAQLGLQPALCFILLTPILTTLAGSHPDELQYILAAAIAGWVLNAVTSPFGLPILITAAAAGTTPAGFLFRDNAIFTIASPVLAALILGIAAS